jgi:hypothetical protein
LIFISLSVSLQGGQLSATRGWLIAPVGQFFVSQAASADALQGFAEAIFVFALAPIYRRLMMSLKVRRRLYLAVPSPVFVTFFQNRAAVREVVAGEQIKLLIFDPLKQEIVRWTR